MPQNMPRAIRRPGPGATPPTAKSGEGLAIVGCATSGPTLVGKGVAAVSDAAAGGLLVAPSPVIQGACGCESRACAAATQGWHIGWPATSSVHSAQIDCWHPTQVAVEAVPPWR